MLEYLISALQSIEAVFIQDFCENYECLFQDEPQSIHWTQRLATVYPVLAILNRNNQLSEDHFVFL